VNPLDLVLKLRELRRLAGLSQKEAALSSGVGEKTLSSFETGERITSMKLAQLLALLAVYDVTPAEFFGGKVEANVFGELERLSARELDFIRELRTLPQEARVRVEEKLSDVIDTAQALTARTPLRLVRKTVSPFPPRLPGASTLNSRRSHSA
jgi:transcriptional regulator with XRE-family HTH domain